MFTTLNPTTLLQHIYESATTFAILTIDLDHKVSSWNAGACTMLGFEAGEILGSDVAQIFTDEDRASHQAEREMQTASLDGRSTDYRWHVRKDGRRFWADGVMTPIRNEQQEIVGFLKILQDTTEQKHAFDESVRLATCDALTGLANRRSFEKRMAEMISLAGRSGQILLMFMVDLDHFKDVNDTLGHQAGDTLLQQVTQRLLDGSRESDFVARLGGEEFAVVQLGAAHPSAGGAFAEKLVKSLALFYRIDGQQVYISASIGIAAYPGDGTEMHDLQKKADLALYKAKSAGRNGFDFFTDELGRAAHKRSVDSVELRKVVLERRFWLEYQPILDCATGKTTAMQALIRFPGPILSACRVDYVIALAQEIGLICDLGGWVFAEAWLQLSRWRAQGIEDLRICINTCAKELLDADYLVTINAALEESGLLPNDVEIELTERDAIDLTDLGSVVLDDLALRGFRLTLDDFGTGFSSLSYLRTLPVASLTLDKSFLHGVPLNSDANAVAKAVISLANDLCLRVIAEGVEDCDQATFLQQMDCAAFQGFLFARALPVSQATAWLQADSMPDCEEPAFSTH